MVVKYPLKGIFKVTAKGRDYWYAWRGPPLGPRLKGAPGSPEFHASYVEAHAALRVPDTGRFYSLVAAYKASADYNKLAPSTKKAWGHWLDRIATILASCALRSSSDRRRSGQSLFVGEASGRTSRALPTMRSRSFPAFCHMP